MNIHLLSVCNTGYASGRRPGFYIYADWLPSMGFIPGALVQTLPTPEEMVFNLCDENIRRYSELDAETKAQGGKLLQVFNASEKYQQSPTLLASGQFLHDAGFTYGDSLVAKYEYGHIRVRKLSGKLKMVSLSSIRDNHTGKMTPKIRMSGGWLPTFGFVPDSPVTVSSKPGIITFQSWDDGAEKYRDLVRFARQNQMRIIQVKECLSRGKSYPCIITTGASVEQAGFVMGESLAASCEQGVIKLQKLELTELGF